MSSSAPSDQELTTVEGRDGAMVFGAPEVARPGPGSGATVGRYLVIEELGRGGMGIVLRGYDPKLQREVALKVLHFRKMDEEAETRLVREARSMAKLSHPNVVAVYDVELAPGVGVVISMEYVVGTTLTHWLDDHETTRTWARTVETFVAAGRGLVAAHDQGLLHRDFKPDNVLVGADARVRVMDFGLARSDQGPDAAEPVSQPSAQGRPTSTEISAIEDVSTVGDLTEAGIMLGTPRFMPPEQMMGKPLDATADQYAFCVSMWFALAGEWPFTNESRRAMLLEKADGPPRWPSSPQVPTPSRIVDAIRRGLHPDPARRWPSVAALLEDLERQPSRRRHVVAGIALAAVVVAGLAGWRVVEQRRAVAACDAAGAEIAQEWNDDVADVVASAFGHTEVPYAADAVARVTDNLGAYTQAWTQARTEVCRAATIEHTMTPSLAAAATACLDERFEQVASLAEQLAAADDDIVQRAAGVSASLPPLADCSDEATLRQQTPMPDDASTRAAVRGVRAKLSRAAATRTLGRFESALALSEEALDDATVLGWEPLRIEAMLAAAHTVQRLNRFEEAEVRFEEAFLAAGRAGRDALAGQAATALAAVTGTKRAHKEEGLRWARIARMFLERLETADSLAEAQVEASVGSIYRTHADYAEAIESHQRALAIREASLPAGHPAIASSLTDLGRCYAWAEHFEEALEVLERALAIHAETLGDKHPELAETLEAIGNIYNRLNDIEASLETHQRVLEIRTEVFGPRDASLGATMTNIGNAYNRLRQNDQALASYRKSLEIYEAALGPNDRQLGAPLNNLGNSLITAGDPEEAQQYFERALAVWEEALGREHPEVALALNNLGRVELVLDRPRQALPLFEEALSIWERQLGPDSQRASIAHRYLGMTMSGLGRPEEALEHRRRELAIWESSAGDQSQQIAGAAMGCAEMLLALGRLADARRYSERAVALASGAGRAATELAAAHLLQARIRWAEGAHADARAAATAAQEAAQKAGMNDGGDRADTAEQIETWLAEHGAASRTP